MEKKRTPINERWSFIRIRDDADNQEERNTGKSETNNRKYRNKRKNLVSRAFNFK